MGIVACLSSRLSAEVKERKRQQANVETLNSSIERYKLQDSLNVVSVSSLNYTIKELKKYRAEDAELIKELKCRPKDVEYIIRTKIERRDSIVYVPDSNGCFHYDDKWLTVDACIKDSSMTIYSCDSITQIIYPKYKHKFLWWRWGLQGVKQEIINYNPNSSVKYSEFVKIENK